MLYSNQELDDKEQEYNRGLRAVRRASNQQEDFLSVFNRLYPNKINDPLWKYMLSAYLEFDTGGTLNTLSARYFDDDTAYNGPEALVTNGYDLLPAYLAKDLTVQLETVIKTISYEDDKVVLTTANQEQLEADFAVITLALGVLQRGGVNFVPALPSAKQEAISRLKMGIVNKFLLQWNTPFWDNQLHYIGYTPNTAGQFNYFLNLHAFGQPPALMTFAYGDYAAQTEQLKDQAIINACMEHLRAIYGAAAPDPINFMRTKWGENPYSFGAYSFCAAGTSEQEVEELAAVVDNKLFFAGEHTSYAYRGTVHGAYQSGLRVAKEIQERL